MFYNEKTSQHNQIYSYGDTKNTYKVALTSDMNQAYMLKTIYPILNDYKANLSLFVSESSQDKNKITEYVFISEPSYFNDISMAEGRFLTEKDNGSNFYVSSKRSSDPNQIGTIDLFPCDWTFIVKSINSESMPDNLFNRYAHLTLSSPDDYSLIKLDLQSNGISVTLDDSEISNEFINFYVILVPIFLAVIFISLSLYEILNSYKKIAVQKLFGITNFQVFLEWIGNSILCMVISAVVSLIMGFLLLLRSFRTSCLAFIGKMIGFDVATILTLLVVVSVPFVYIHKIKPSEMLRNKKPVTMIEAMNFVFKVIVGTVSVLMLVSSIGNYQVIKSFLRDRYSNWDDTKDYYISTGFFTKYDDPWDSRIQEASYNAYCYFNQHGSILADFDDFIDTNYDENMEHLGHLEYRAAQATVNPNYLKKHPIVDEKGYRIEISENEKQMIALVPVKYKSDEANLVKDYKERISENIKIIWTANGQKAFSYRIDINPSNGNCVDDPVILVVTQGNTDIEHWYYTEDYMGEPLKVKTLSDGINAKEEILNTYYQYYDSENCRIVLENVYSCVKSDIEQMKISAYWILGICVAFSVLLVVIIIQCLYLYFEERKQSIAVMRLMGIHLFLRYNRLFQDVLASWIGIMLICLLFNHSMSVVVVSLSGFVLEMLGLVIFVKRNEMKKVVNILKNK